ncbi:AMP-binding protein [Hydrogenophaga sp.]|uniref:AMP-binding protein n=1 Tax=Hydrogenophaga sp. TaxID=1904254 RepID=UPI00271B7829|nr:AMP-binding protein [Hydrogenophaga sp.]MDO9603822.1 AMP-binding protein [Hydrogenophaga sp.]
MNTPMDNTPGWTTGHRDTPVAALARAVATHPHKVLFDFSGETTTYAEFDALTNRMAHALRALGVKTGATVTSLFDNHLDAVVLWIALNKLGAVSVPLNTALKGEFLRHQVVDSGAEIVVCEAVYVPRLFEVSEHIGNVKRVLVRGTLEVRPSVGFAIDHLDEHRGFDATPMAELPDPAALNALIYTSGTTGPSKGCMISGNQMCHVARLLLRAAPFGPDDVLWTPLPLYHMNAIATGVVSTLLVGATISIAPRFSVSGFWPAVEASGATVVSILGALGTLLAQAPDNDAMQRCFGQIHTVKGNPFPEEIKAIWRTRFGARQIGSNAYGLTEALITSVPAGEPVPPGSSGRCAPEFDVRIFDDQDNPLPPGQAGEVVCRPLHPDIMFKGYWRRAEDTQKVMGNMWFHTGDIGKFDEAGFFYFVDRKKDYLRRRGENISSFEMESAILLHPDVEQVAVHAVRSNLGEDDLKVTAMLVAHVQLSEEALCRWLVDRVPYYAVPRYIEFREELPVNPQGRVLKYQLRDEGVTPATWDIEKSSIKVQR